MRDYTNSRSSGSFRGKSNRSYHSGPRNGGSGRGTSFGFGGGRRRPQRRMETFDPSDIVQKAVDRSTQVEEAVTIKHAFTDFVIHDQIKKNIIERGFVTPTPIQDQIIPLILEGKDIVGSASTGTGKTAAFLIPLIDNVIQGRTEKVLILAPTRELAEQIQHELNLLKKGLPIYSALLIGGEHIVKQYKQLERNPQFVVATPGRLIDLEDRGRIYFNQFTTIVLDEFDTMLDMGFVNEVKDVMAKLPTKRHVVFFSATMPKKLAQIVDSLLKNPVKVSVNTRPSSDNVNQEIIKLNGRNKFNLLCELLQKDEFEKVLVFGKTKRDTNDLSQSLIKLNIPSVAIHGNKTQDQRKRALNQFRNNKVKVMLATDVVSRGLDIDNVTHVINYDLPKSYEDYVHRIGRTGRGNKTGVALTFVD